MITNGRVQAFIDLTALAHNFQIARNNCPDSHIVAVVKANAYGHGAAAIARALPKADLLGVTDVREALLLNEHALPQPILIMQGIIDPSDLDQVALHNFRLMVHSLEQIALMEAHFRAHPPSQALSLWLKMDSGMGRLGIAPEDYVEAWQRLAAKTWCRDLVMTTHFASASLPDAELTTLQLKNFRRIEKKLRSTFPKLSTSIAASSALLAARDIEEDWSRLGIMLYGSSPFPWEHQPCRAEQLGLLPVMTLQSRLISIKNLNKGDNVGYCSQFVCPRAMRVGIVSIGYADGYPSNAPNFTPVLVNGKRSHTLGRVSMDMLAVDLTELPEASLGDTVTLWGRGLSVDEVADHTGILSYNLFCSVSQRVAIHYG